MQEEIRALFERADAIRNREDVPVFIRDAAEDLCETIADTYVMSHVVPSFVPEGLAG